MKTWVKVLFGGVGGFAAGFFVGYFVRKKAFEVQIEEVSEEELEKLAEEAEGINAEEENSSEQPHFDPISQDEKEAYFKRWKSEAPEETENADIYDTRSKETPDDVVVDEDLDAIEDYLEGVASIEAGNMQDWMHWTSVPDGEYDTLELTWYEKDDVICDENGEPLTDSEKFIGFDVDEQFKLIDPETTGDDDVRIIFNHKTHCLYYITRVSNTLYAQMRRHIEFGRDGYDDEELEE